MATEESKRCPPFRTARAAPQSAAGEIPLDAARGRGSPYTDAGGLRVSPPIGGRSRLHRLPSREERLPASVSARARRGVSVNTRPAGNGTPWWSDRGAERPLAVWTAFPSVPTPPPALRSFEAGRAQGSVGADTCRLVTLGPLPSLGASAAAGLETRWRLRGAAATRVRVPAALRRGQRQLLPAGAGRDSSAPPGL